MKPLPLLLVALLSLAPAPGKDAVPPPKDKPLELDPLRIHEKPIISFAVDIVVFSRAEDRTVNKIFIEAVWPNTDAEKAGLQKGDEIVKLDGQPVKGLPALIVADSPLGRLLLGRPVGDAMIFEVFTSRQREYALRAIPGEPTTFGVDLGISLSATTGRVDRAFITRVRPGSDAEKAGLRPEDEILRLDGFPVEGMAPDVGATSQLGRLLLGRPVGDTIRMEIVTRRAQEIKLRAQRGLPWQK